MEHLCCKKCGAPYSTDDKVFKNHLVWVDKFGKMVPVYNSDMGRLFDIVLDQLPKEGLLHYQDEIKKRLLSLT